MQRDSVAGLIDPILTVRGREAEVHASQSGGAQTGLRVRGTGRRVAAAPMLTERRDWFASTIGPGGRRKLAERWLRVGRMSAKSPTSRKEREKLALGYLTSSSTSGA